MTQRGKDTKDKEKDKKRERRRHKDTERQSDKETKRQRHKETRTARHEDTMTKKRTVKRAEDAHMTTHLKEHKNEKHVQGLTTHYTSRKTSNGQALGHANTLCVRPARLVTDKKQRRIQKT